MRELAADLVMHFSQSYNGDWSDQEELVARCAKAGLPASGDFYERLL